jgi:hypothetical protein
MSDEPIFNENSEDIILGRPNAKARDFIVYNRRNTLYETAGDVEYNNPDGQTKFNTTKTTYNTKQGLDVITSAGTVTVDAGANVSASGNITTPLTMFANQGTFTTNVTAASVIGAIGQFTTSVQSALGIFESVSAPFKLFDIPHPQKEGMRLRHGCLEGPELAVYARGKTSGPVIPLPEYWVDLIDDKTITVQLTATSDSQFLYVQTVNAKEIYIGGDVDFPYFYMVMAERKDVPKLDIETHA